MQDKKEKEKEKWIKDKKECQYSWFIEKLFFAGDNQLSANASSKKKPAPCMTVGKKVFTPCMEAGKKSARPMAFCTGPILPINIARSLIGVMKSRPNDTGQKTLFCKCEVCQNWEV